MLTLCRQNEIERLRDKGFGEQNSKVTMKFVNGEIFINKYIKSIFFKRVHSDCKVINPSNIEGCVKATLAGYFQGVAIYICSSVGRVCYTSRLPHLVSRRAANPLLAFIICLIMEGSNQRHAG